MSSQRRNLIVGVVVLLALGILTWMLLTFAGNVASLFSRPGISVALTSDRADGLSNGSIVYYRGVSCGKVISVSRTPDNEHVQVELDLDREPPLPSNLSGIIRTSSALGSSAVIDLELIGPPSQTPLKAGDQLQATFAGLELVPPEITGLAGDIRQQQFILHLDQTVVSIREQAAKAGEVLDSVNKLISDPKVQENVKSAVANLRTASDSAARIGAKVEALSDKLDKTMDNANATVTDLKATIDHTNSHVDDLSRQVSDDTNKLGSAFEQIQLAAAKINDGKGTAGLLVNDPKLYNSLVDTVKTLDATVRDLQRVIDQWEQEGVSLKMGK
jgi:phospholipid/cholesterol/gamma-HCH transport system substrate-binding protein